MKIRLLMAVGLGAATLSAQAADAAKGEKLAQAQCVACHGKDFVTPVDPTYPKLAGAVCRLPREGTTRLQERRAQEPDHGRHREATFAHGH